MIARRQPGEGRLNALARVGYIGLVDRDRCSAVLEAGGLASGNGRRNISGAWRVDRGFFSGGFFGLEVVSRIILDKSLSGGRCLVSRVDVATLVR